MTFPALPDAALDQLFRQAHTVHAFAPTPIPEATLRQLYDTVKWAPTAFNAQPARFVFVQSQAGKDKLIPTLMEGNVPQVQSAAVTVIVAQDKHFYNQLPTLMPAYDAKPMFEANPALVESTAFRNSSMQGAYLILAARALGLAAGAMSGFNPEALNQAFFPEGNWKANFLITLGVADPKGIYPRNPRLAFEDAASIV